MEKHFLHTLSRAEGHRNYLIAGVEWSGSDYCGRDQVSRGITDTAGNRVGHLSVEADCYGADGGYFWKYYLNVTERFLFSHQGKADSVEAACAAAVAFIPETMIFEYLGRAYTIYGTVRKDGFCNWETDIDGDVSSFKGPFQHGTEPEYWYWERPWEPAKAVLLFLDRRQLGGTSQSLRAAIIAAIDGPELFKRACGELVATLSENISRGCSHETA